MNRPLLLALAAALLALVGCPLLGDLTLDPAQILAPGSLDREIYLTVRLPRTLLAFLAGACLSVAAVLLQTLMRTPLATPDTLGVSAGASLGAVLVIVVGLRFPIPAPAVWIGAGLGAALFLLAALRLGSPQGTFSPLHLLLAGLALNSLAVAAILALQYTSTLAQSLSITRWLMGGFDPLPYPTLAAMTLTAAAVIAWILRHAPVWNLLAPGLDWAAARGVPAKRYAQLGVAAAAILTALISAVAGPIAFVGLLVPYIVRILAGADHRTLLPASLLAGGAFLALCDTLARTLLAPADLPAGILTAALGVPFFLYLLRKPDLRW